MGSARKSSRSTSPAVTRSASKKKTSSKKKKEEEEDEDLKVQDETYVEKKQTSSKKKSSSSSSKKPKKQAEKVVEEEEEDEYKEAIVLEKAGYDLFESFLAETLTDSSTLHNVIRVQYVQLYFLGLYILGSTFTTTSGEIPLLEGVKPMIKGLIGAFLLGQALLLTAAAQTTYSSMKKTLQYNMIFHLLASFVLIVHQEVGTKQPIQALVAAHVFNVALNMWACYFHEVKNPLDDDDEDDDEEDEEDEGEETE